MMLPTAFVNTATSTLPTFVNMCSQAAPLVSVVLLTAPMPTIKSVEKAQSVGDMPLLPYSSMAANCGLWTTYGYLKQEAAILVPNVVGLVLAVYYMKKYIRFSPPKAPTLPGSVKQHLTAVTITLAAALLAGLTRFRPDVIGMAAVLFCIAMFGSPLASLKTVIRTKSAASIPLPFTVASVANCFLWTVTGVWKLKDANVIVPNALGLGFGLAQVFLKILYNDNRESDRNPNYVLATP